MKPKLGDVVYWGGALLYYIIDIKDEYTKNYTGSLKEGFLLSEGSANNAGYKIYTSMFREEE